MPDPVFHRLYQETAKLTWPSATEVRVRGRRRTVNQRLAVVAGAFVAVILLVGGAVVAAGRPVSVPIGPGTPSPSSPAALMTSIPPGMMLQPADAGSGRWNAVAPVGDWKLQFTLSLCAAKGSVVPPSTLDSRDARLEREADRAVVQESLAAYPAGAAATAYEQLREAVNVCALFTSSFIDGAISLTVLADSFAGESSFLVRTRTSAGSQLNAVFQQGNVVGQIDVEPADQSQLVALSRLAVSKTCVTPKFC